MNIHFYAVGYNGDKTYLYFVSYHKEVQICCVTEKVQKNK